MLTPRCTRVRRIVASTPPGIDVLAIQLHQRSVGPVLFKLADLDAKFRYELSRSLPLESCRPEARARWSIMSTVCSNDVIFSELTKLSCSGSVNAEIWHQQSVQHQLGSVAVTFGSVNSSPLGSFARDHTFADLSAAAEDHAVHLQAYDSLSQAVGLNAPCPQPQQPQPQAAVGPSSDGPTRSGASAWATGADQGCAHACDSSYRLAGKMRHVHSSSSESDLLRGIVGCAMRRP